MATRDKRAKTNKPRRVPLSGIRDIMTVFNKDPQFHYRWINAPQENASRILNAIRGGYEFARSETESGEYVVGEEAVYKSEQHGSIVRLPVGNDTFAYLMRIPVELYEEDQQEKEDHLREIEDQIYRTGSQEGEDFGQYGEVGIGRKRIEETL